MGTHLHSDDGALFLCSSCPLPPSSLPATLSPIVSESWAHPLTHVSSLWYPGQKSLVADKDHKSGQHLASDTTWHPLCMGLETPYARGPKRPSRPVNSALSNSPLLACFASTLNTSPCDGLSFSVTITFIFPSAHHLLFPLPQPDAFYWPSGALIHWQTFFSTM